MGKKSYTVHVTVSYSVEVSDADCVGDAIAKAIGRVEKEGNAFWSEAEIFETHEEKLPRKGRGSY